MAAGTGEGDQVSGFAAGSFEKIQETIGKVGYEKAAETLPSGGLLMLECGAYAAHRKS
jgi:hypothetical protein